MGSSRRQHHRQQESMREATRVRNAYEAQQRAYEQAMLAQTEALKKPADFYKAPETDTPRSVYETSKVGVRSARSQRGTARNLAKGIASLRIPLNIGGGSGGGLNIG